MAKKIIKINDTQRGLRAVGGIDPERPKGDAGSISIWTEKQSLL